MRVDLKVLDQYGSTNERLKEIFTAVGLDAKEAKNLSAEEKQKRERDIKTRERWEKSIHDRLYEAVCWSLQNYQLYAAVDLAWDASPINKYNLPLLMYAQGKIRLEQVSKELADLPNSDKFLKRDEVGNVVQVDLPKFFQFNVNVVRAIITRRMAAQLNKFNNLWPHFKYESRSTGNVGKCRADVLSQRTDIMADQFGWRHHDGQVVRDMFLYAHSFDFIRSSWETDRQMYMRNGTPVSTIVREGLSFVNPHPSRVYWDNSEPMASLNDDIGCRYIGFWDIARYRDIYNDTNYFNRHAIRYGYGSGTLWGNYAIYQAYFNQYYKSILPPPNSTSNPQTVQTLDPAGANDRKNLVGLYAGDMLDQSVFITQHFEKVIPKDIGWGEYPYPVWVRLVIGGDETVIYAESLPSSPGAYFGLNENDSRQLNISFAHALLPYQDQMTNLTTQLLYEVNYELLKVITINKDLFTEEEIKLARKHLSAMDFGGGPLVLEHSFKQLDELGINPQRLVHAVEITETKTSDAITKIVQAMAQLVGLLERLESLSPAEQGQPAPREISATEVSEIAATTSAVYSYISDAIDEGRAAKKRIVYESLLSCGKSEVRVPVVNRYSRKTLAEAGFEPLAEADEMLVIDGVDRPMQRTVIGTVNALEHDYIFTSRDGAERPVNVHAANTLMQLLGQVVQIPTVLQAMGKEKLYNIINEVFRMSGAGVDLMLELQEGEDDTLGMDQVQQLQQMVQELVSGVSGLAEAVKQNSEELAQQKAVNDDQEGALKALNELAAQVKKNAQDIASIFQKRTEPPEIPYKEAPEDVKRQMEQVAGYSASKLPPEPEPEQKPAKRPK